ncbi:thiol:disulfide interchange protein DsbD [Deltaproteobacteria bacterium]|nr:thiol:disulfide interchange protein DsbD [Deltaproteobacteria bacterium]
MIAAAFAVLSSFALAEESPVRVEVADASGAPGTTVQVGVHFLIPPGTHIYADMIDVTVLGTPAVSVGALVEPAGRLVADPANPAKQRETYEAGDTRVDLPVSLPADATGTYPVKLLVRHQACREGLCFPPAEDTLTANVGVAGVTPVPGIGAAHAQSPEEEVAAVFSAATSSAGTVAVHVDLQGEWHINKMFVSLSVSDPQGFTLGDLVLPKPTPSGSEADGTFREDFTTDFTVVAPISGPEGAATVTVDIAYQACKGVSLCRMPTSEAVKVPVTVLAAGVLPVLPDPATLASPAEAAHVESVATTTKSPAPEVPVEDDDDFAAAASKGFPFLLLLCFLAGVGVSFTPCVLPMVPIIMGIIGARGATSKAESFSLTLAYTLGQTLVYTGLGVFMALTGGLFGSQMQNPILVGAIGILFVALSLSMFGFFDLQVPGFIQSRISGYEKRGGYLVSFTFGMIGGVLAGPCSGPVVIAILSVIATSGEVVKGAALMASFATGMGMIFLVAGVAFSALPKRGAYMVLIKKSFGPLLLLLAIYFTKTLFSDTQIALLTSAVLLVTGVFAWPDPEDGEGFYLQRIRQLYTVVAVIIGGWLLVGVLGATSPLAVNGAGAKGEAAIASGPQIHWASTEAEALALSAAAGGKPLMIDFTAEWCAACHEMEKFTYTNAAVIAASGDFVTVMIDCTDKADPVVKAVQEKYGVKGLPTVVFAKPDGTILAHTVGFVEAEEFVTVMGKAKGKAG